ncbi:MAG: hypothetical protein ACYCXY_12680 [Acidimicrobiales bacterium]
MPARTPPPPYRLKSNAGAPPLAQAVSIALAVLRAAGARRWDELGESLPAAIELSADQHQLLVDHADVLGFLRLTQKTEEGRSPTVTVAVCPACDEWVLASKGPAPTRCEITRGCTGKPVKAAVATKDAGQVRRAA